MSKELLPRPVWVSLVVIDFCLLLLGFMTRNLMTSLLALLLAFLIDKYGLETLLGSDKGENIRLHKKVEITREQRKAIITALKDQRASRRAEQKSDTAGH
ncbi:hypothetical protein [Olsenella uli]|uniref:hypothetical protein n=1 Tax=Olsenella uli TaxID=133926 RepID=UPI000569DD49|nr:hypothetical protein [Olsenella uli]MBS6418227.1 hypothetical protein [Olsenella uli]